MVLPASALAAMAMAMPKPGTSFLAYRKRNSNSFRDRYKNLLERLVEDEAQENALFEAFRQEQLETYKKPSPRAKDVAKKEEEEEKLMPPDHTVSLTSGDEGDLGHKSDIPKAENPAAGDRAIEADGTAVYTAL